MNNYNSWSWLWPKACLCTLTVLTCISLTNVQAQRVTDGLVTLYDFSEGTGSTVNDISGVGTALDLTIDNPANITWLSGSGISINSDVTIQASGSSDKIINMIQATDEYTVEAWVSPYNMAYSSSVPRRIVSYSNNTLERNFTLGQTGANYVSRTRSDSNDNGTPDFSVGGANIALQHVVMTRNSAGDEKMYIDGVLVSTQNRAGDCSGWENSYSFVLANELTNDRAWHGEMYLVALYDKALSTSEISQNRGAGVNSSTCQTAIQSMNCDVDNMAGDVRIGWFQNLPGFASPTKFKAASGAPLSFVRATDGTASLTGELVSIEDPGSSWIVDFNFLNESTYTEWLAQGKDAKGATGYDPSTWVFYDIDGSSSTLTGAGNLAGSSLTVENRAGSIYGLQIGEGANDIDGDAGMSTWLDYTGTVNGTYVTDNEMDINGSGLCTEEVDLLPELTNIPNDITLACGDPIPTPPNTCVGFTSTIKYGVSIPMSSDVDNEHNILGGPDGLFGEFYDEDDEAQVDFGCDLPVGTEVCVIWKVRDYSSCPGAIATIDVWAMNGTSFVQDVDLTSDVRDEFVTSCFTLTSVADIIKLRKSNGDCGTDFEVDAVKVTLPGTCDPSDIISSVIGSTIDFTETVTCAGGVSSIEREWTVSNGCGANSYTQLINITLEDPIFSVTPVDATVDCASIPTAPLVTAIDPCAGSASVTVAYDEVIGTPGSSVTGCYTITRTWTANGTCGTSISHTQVLTVEDNDAPVITSYSGTGFSSIDAFGNYIYMVECGIAAIPAVSVLTASDCTSLTYDFNETSLPIPCDVSPTSVVLQLITREYSFTDACGNETSIKDIISVVDNTPPALSGVPGDLILTCGDAIPMAPTVIAIDACDPTPSVTFSETSTSTSITRTWVGIDDCGNMVTESQVITISTCTPPTTNPEVIYVCYETDGVIDILANDTPGDNPIDPSSVMIISGPSNGTISVNSITGLVTYTPNPGFTGSDSFTYTVKDDEGNESNPSIVSITVGSQITKTGDISDATCGALNGAIDLTVSGGIGVYTYSWSNGSTLEDQSGLAPGIYTVTVTDSEGCTCEQTFTVGEIDLGIAGVTVDPATSCDANDGKVNIDLSAAGSGPYTVIINGGFTFGPFATEPIMIMGAPGGATITSIEVTDANGCTAEDNGVYEIEEPSIEVAAITYADADCATGMGSVTIDLDDAIPGMPNYMVKIGPSTYGPFTSEPITVMLPPGVYNKVGVRDSKGCADLKPITVVIMPPTGCVDECPIPTGNFEIVQGHHTTDLFWNASATGTGEYILEIREFGSTAWNVVSVLDTTKVIGGLAPCLSYEWRVANVCLDDTSHTTAVRTFTTDCTRLGEVDFRETNTYPNPASSVINFSIEMGVAADVQVELYDVTGRILYAKDAGLTATFYTQVNVSHWATGMYTVKWIVDGQSSVERFVVAGE